MDSGRSHSPLDTGEAGRLIYAGSSQMANSFLGYFCGMKSGIARFILTVVLCAGLPRMSLAQSQTNIVPRDPDVAAVEKAECVGNLHHIYSAIQKYQAD